MVCIEPHASGTIIPVRVKAGARRNGIVGQHDGALRIDVSAAPEKGKANRAVVVVLSEALRIAKSSIELVSGSTSSQKRLLLHGLELKAAERRLSEVLQSLG
jgi:uncharacterized protein (TIGR00251 family)